MVAEQLDTVNKGIGWYTSLDMQYALGQVPSDKETAKHCNFQIVGGKATGTYRFITGFYGLTVMTTQFQKAMNANLGNIPNTYVFLDDILVVTKGSKENHYKVVKTVLTKLKKANTRLKWERYRMVRIETNSNRNQPDKCKNTSNNRKIITEKPNKITFKSWSRKPDEQIHTRPSSIVL